MSDEAFNSFEEFIVFKTSIKYNITENTPLISVENIPDNQVISISICKVQDDFLIFPPHTLVLVTKNGFLDTGFTTSYSKTNISGAWFIDNVFDKTIENAYLIQNLYTKEYVIYPIQQVN